VLFTKPYYSNDGEVLLRVCAAMGMLLHSNEHLQISTVVDGLSMFTMGRMIPWEAPTLPFKPEPSVFSSAVKICKNLNIQDYNFACGSV
jgi:hypothetical protein